MKHLRFFSCDCLLVLQDTHTTRMDARKKQKSAKAAMAEEMAVVQAAKVAEANRCVCFRVCVCSITILTH